MLTFSALIEGFGVLLVYAECGYELPDELVRNLRSGSLECLPENKHNINT